MTTAILVTGGAGYVGSHACKALVAAGYVPVTYDSLARGRRGAVRWGPLEVGDLADAAALDAAFARHRPAAVLHFAGLIAVGESVAEPEPYYRANLGGLLALLSAMRRHGTGRLVFSSSAAVYGEPQSVPIPEDHPTAPLSPYAFSKLAAERILADWAAAYGLRAVALRYFNAAGADPDGELGEDHEPETHLIPLALRALAPGAAPLAVFGTDYPTPDGTALRDYVHVADLAEAHVAALGWLEAEEKAGEGAGRFATFNLGTGRGHSVREVLAAVEAAAGAPVPVCDAPRRPGDAPALVADPARARAALGWAPRLSDLHTIVSTAAAWEAARPKIET